MTGQSVLPGTRYETPKRSARVRIVEARYPTIWYRHDAVTDPLMASMGWQEFFRTFRQVKPCDGSG